MKNGLLIICLLLMSIQSVYAEPYIVVNVNDDQVIESEDAHEVRSIASITKIMTCLIALEYGDFTDIWSVGDELDEAWGSMIHLTKGQEVSMRSLLYGLMLKSGNDASLVIADRVGGSVEDFVALMNKKAEEIGMFNTVFNNPHGLDVYEEGNYSTVFDMALLMSEALENPMFKEIISTKEYTSEWGVTWRNSNDLLHDFPFCIGGKTGFTNKAGRTLVSAAEKDGAMYVVVTFNLQDRYPFHEEKYLEVMKDRSVHELLSVQTINQENYVIDIDYPFEIVATEEELENGTLSTYLDKKNDEYIVEWYYKEHRKVEIYDANKQTCIWGWCF